MNVRRLTLEVFVVVVFPEEFFKDWVFENTYRCYRYLVCSANSGHYPTPVEIPSGRCETICKKRG